MRLFVIGLLFCFGAAGGMEHLPANASIADYLTLLGFAVVGLAFVLTGVMDIKGE